MGPLPADQAAILAAVLDRLIPADANGPGAVDAGVVRFVIRILETDEALRAQYTAGLGRLGPAFPGLDAAARDARLAELERSADPFFELVRLHTVQGMFGDPSYGGNEGQAGWKLIGFPGPKVTFTEEDQRIDA